MKWGLPVEVDPRLREADLGRWEGRSRADVAGRFPDEYARWGRGGRTSPVAVVNVRARSPSARWRRSPSTPPACRRGPRWS
ncbi:histidine phosphatase family protein [Candidatus Frankia alpina]|uniref:Histidine phosphatase family protein n=1 Tax=Candidatus Frankia alpina TaxID=2699483 RepID=A0A4S5C4X7_9ACTN|nr:histidine phosphatase family protein [Candidatus Frankia alpina]